MTWQKILRLYLKWYTTHLETYNASTPKFHDLITKAITYSYISARDLGFLAGQLFMHMSFKEKCVSSLIMITSQKGKKKKKLVMHNSLGGTAIKSKETTVVTHIC